MQLLRYKSELLINRRRQDVLDMIDICACKTNVGKETHARFIEKEARKRRRREIRSKIDCQANSVHYEGYSSDDELLPSTESKFQLDIGKSEGLA